MFYHRRIREKYEAELREVERSERSTLEKFNSMKVSVYTDRSTHVLYGSLSCDVLGGTCTMLVYKEIVAIL